MSEQRRGLAKRSVQTTIQFFLCLLTSLILAACTPQKDQWFAAQEGKIGPVYSREWIMKKHVYGIRLGMTVNEVLSAIKGKADVRQMGGQYSEEQPWRPRYSFTKLRNVTLPHDDLATPYVNSVNDRGYPPGLLIYTTTTAGREVVTGIKYSTRGHMGANNSPGPPTEAFATFANNRTVPTFLYSNTRGWADTETLRVMDACGLPQVSPQFKGLGSCRGLSLPPSSFLSIQNYRNAAVEIDLRDVETGLNHLKELEGFE